MAFDAATYPIPTASTVPVMDVDVLCPIWAAANPDKALAFLFVVPQDCAAVDILMAI